MKAKPKSKVPKHLTAETAEWWIGVIAEYEMEPHHVRLLTLATEAWDRCQQARGILAKKGLTYEDRFSQPVARPEVAIERDSRTAFARLLRELDLDSVIPREASRPPGLG